MEVLDLIKHLQARPLKMSRDQLGKLEKRKREELEFHNLDREKQDPNLIAKREETGIHENKKFYSIAKDTYDYVNRWLNENVKDKVFLDYACGDGKEVIRAANYGARLAIGIDISDVSIDNATNLAIREGVSDRCLFVQADCECTELPDESIDIILCSGMLHHLDLRSAFPELHRILKPNGKIMANEALVHNPIIQWYRDRTPEMRTEWEKAHILGMKDIKFAKKFFHLGEIRYWYLFSIGAVVFRNSVLFNPILRLLSAIDAVVLKVPFIQRMAWQFTFELKKPSNSLKNG